MASEYPIKIYPYEATLQYNRILAKQKNGHSQKWFIVHAGLCMTKEYVLFALFSVGFA